ncbi:MAG: hypothetical protein VX015_02970 [Planctomycetota bacterium]|nr:hypothetical protein [Planctomycetota bacterium]
MSPGVLGGKRGRDALEAHALGEAIGVVLDGHAGHVDPPRTA